jgi:5'-3' exonuclease
MRRARQAGRAERARAHPLARGPSRAQVIEADFGSGGKVRAPAQLERRLSFSKRRTVKELQQQLEAKQDQAAENREATLAAKVERARAGAVPGTPRDPPTAR